MKKRTMNELRQEKNYGYKPPLTYNQKSAEARVKGYTEIDIDTTKELIISDLKDEMFDIIFQAVNDEKVWFLEELIEQLQNELEYYENED